MSLVDIATFASTLPVPSIEVGPQDLLYAIVKTLGCARGQKSRYLENLLNHSQIVLGLDRYGAQKSLELPHQLATSCVEYLPEDTERESGTRFADVSVLSGCNLESYQSYDDELPSCLTADERSAHNGWPWPSTANCSIPQTEMMSVCTSGQSMLPL